MFQSCDRKTNNWKSLEDDFLGRNRHRSEYVFYTFMKNKTSLRTQQKLYICRLCPHTYFQKDAISDYCQYCQATIFTAG